MYYGNGTTKTFPLPPEFDGSAVYLVTGSGTVRMKEGDAYTVQDGGVVFDIPPPEGSEVSFEAPANPAGVKGICVVLYPDGTMKEIAEDPHELLVEAKAERAEAKRLLRSALDAVDKTERVVQVEGEIAREKLTARLEKYSTLVEDSIKGAANVARDEVKDQLDKNILEVRNKHKTVAAMHAQMEALLQEAKEVAGNAAAEAAESVKEKCGCADEAVREISEMKKEISSMRDEAKNAAANSGAEVTKAAGEFMQSVIEEVRSMKSAAWNDVSASVEKAKAENAAVTEEAKAARDESRRLLASIASIERRCGEIDAATQAREAGMRTLWDRITGFRKTFDARVSQMRANSREGEE